jgi:hypothetical protein
VSPVVRLLVACIVMPCAMLGGCAAASIPRVERSAEAPTGGMDLVLSIQDRRDGRFERFRLDRTGTLHYGGGKAAITEKETWSRPLTGGEIDLVVGILDANDWWSGLPNSRGEPRLFQWDIELASGRHRRQAWGRGACAGVSEMHEALRGFAAGRFAPELDRITNQGDASEDDEVAEDQLEQE